MSDWYLLGVPLVVLALVTLAVFAGCQFVFPIDEDEEKEEVGTTHGTGPPDFIPVDVQISAGCDATANAVHIVLSSNIPTAESIPFTLTMVPTEGQTLSTEGMLITLDDEGQVVCTVDITPAEGEPPPPLQATHEKIKGELLSPFTLACQDGFALT